MTKDELFELTGARQRQKVCRILRALKIHHEVVEGEVKVLKSVAEAKFGGSKPKAGASEPDFSFLKEPNRGKTAQKSRRAA